MAFAKSYLGDTVASNVVLQTIQPISGIIGGVTVKPELAGLIQANVVEFWYNTAPAIEVGTAGDDFGTANVGSKKATLTLERGLRFQEKIPQVAYDTTGVDIVADVAAKGALKMANEAGKLFFTALLGLAQAKTYANGAELVDAIAEGIATFKNGASVKINGVDDTTFSNATNGIAPTTIVLGVDGEKKLRQDPSFKDLFSGTQQMPGVIGQLFGLNVVVSQHVTGVDFILLNYEGVAFPYSLQALRTVESEDFVGVKVQGEMAIPLAHASSPAILVIDSYAMKFTEASAE
jgi:hypothetical protein